MRRLLFLLLFLVLPFSAFHAQTYQQSPDIAHIHGDTDSIALPPPPPIPAALQPTVDSISGWYIHVLNRDTAFAVVMTRERHILVVMFVRDGKDVLINAGNWLPIAKAMTPESTIVDVLGAIYYHPPARGIVMFGVDKSGNKVLVSAQGLVFHYDKRASDASSLTAP